ncbi:EAL domain-containing protein [Sulfurimonas sp. HSL3-7]|uniref:putative bifunctional diguanylate cyclase/phosphodiesterase n=1 Tax=Sulfonitrofixus jiaomeiensis TaxID=3131938 RepID=UPI0031F77AFA
MKNFSLTNKLSLLLIVIIVLSSAALGFYFDTFLKENYFQTTQKRMYHGFHRMSSDLSKITDDLSKGTVFIQSDESILASIDLINNYQDKMHYNTILLDEEKKNIAQLLLTKVKLSLKHDIALYDKNEELIAYVVKEADGYCLNFISYQNGSRVLYCKHEHQPLYIKKPFQEHPQIPFKHISYYRNDQLAHHALITYHFFQDEISVRSHRSIFSSASKEVLAHIEIACQFGKTYLNALSEDLDMIVAASQDQRYARYASPLLEDKVLEQMHISQTDEAYYGAASLQTENGPVYLIATLNKALLKNALDENRKKLVFFLLFGTVTVLLMLRFLFARTLSRPMETLMEQIRKIENGDYSRSKLVNTGDELETISTNMRQLAMTVRERESALQTSQEDLEYLSYHDALTDLPNRRLFRQRLDHAIELSKRNGTKAAVLFLDCDHFKQTNDTLGHNIGDELLKAVSERLEEGLRKTDTLARIGGDEFTVLIEEVNDIDEINTVVKKIHDDFKTPFLCGEHKISITASIGIALYPDDGRNSMTLIKNADLAMYKSKEKGRNRHTFFSKKLSDFLEERTMQTRALTSAVEKSDEFTLLYQPKVSLHNGRTTAVEALIRWHSPKLGFVPTEHFIALAEETHLIIPVGEWVLRQACSDFVKLLEEGYALEYISINVSSIQLIHSDMTATLKRVIAATGIAANQIELEITESYIATNTQKMMQTLQEIRAMGVNLAIDDFGTGYSSMSYLQKLPVTRLKIDKSFTDGLPDSTEHIAITKAIIALAKTFDLEITAEGVETASQVALLKQEQCDEVQGYFYSKPLGIDALKAFCHGSRS